MRTIIQSPLFAVMLILVTATSLSAQAAGSITGTVVDRETERPIAGTQVFVPGSLDKNPMPYGDATPTDRMAIGNGMPDFYLALNNTFQWRNLDLNVNMRGAFGHQILNFGRLYYENLDDTQYNMLQSAFKKVYGKALLDYAPVHVDYYVEDGDYWRIDNAALGYPFETASLPSFLSTAVSSARIHVAGCNLLTLTGHKGPDPEVQTTGLAPGMDHRDQYSTTRTFTLGMNLVS